MTLRSVHNIIHPQPRPMGPLTMHQPLPAAGLNQIDPFLLLHHHGPQVFPAPNHGLPFSPHPHRGFETVTFIYEGDVQHRDSSGFASTIRKGGVQWMTAGSGLVHAEESSEEFLESGGPVELIQLWTNLPARHKMVKPTYTGLQAPEIPLASIDHGSVAVVSGEWNGVPGPIKPLIDLSLATITLQKGGTFIREIPAEYNILFYLLNGSITVNGTSVSNRSLVHFAADGDEIRVEALDQARILLGFAKPLNEPVVAHGPFVMNTYEEIQQAITDYQSGKMGVL